MSVLSKLAIVVDLKEGQPSIALQSRYSDGTLIVVPLLRGEIRSVLETLADLLGHKETIH